MKNLIKLLGILIFCAAIVAFLFVYLGNYKNTPNSQGNDIQNKSQGEVVIPQNAKVVYQAFDPSNQEYIKPPQMIISGLDEGSARVIYSHVFQNISVDAYGIFGYDGESIWLGDSQGNFNPLNESRSMSGLLSPDKSFLVKVERAEGGNKQLQLWGTKLATGKTVLLVDDLEKYGIPGFGRILPYAYSADSQSLYLLYAGDSIQAYDGRSTDMVVLNLATKAIKKVHLSDKDINQIVLSPDHKKIAFSCFVDDNKFYIYDFASGETQVFDGYIPYGGIGGGQQLWSPDATKFVYINHSQSEAGGVIEYIDIPKGTSHSVGPIMGGYGSFYWLDEATILALHQTYNRNNQSFWDRASTIYNIKTGQVATFNEPEYAQGLIGIIPAQSQ